MGVMVIFLALVRSHQSTSRTGSFGPVPPTVDKIHALSRASRCGWRGTPRRTGRGWGLGAGGGVNGLWLDFGGNVSTYRNGFYLLVSLANCTSHDRCMHTCAHTPEYTLVGVVTFYFDIYVLALAARPRLAYSFKKSTREAGSFSCGTRFSGTYGSRYQSRS